MRFMRRLVTEMEKKSTQRLYSAQYPPELIP